MTASSIRTALLFSSWLTLAASAAPAQPAAGGATSAASAIHKGGGAKKKKKPRRPIFSGYQVSESSLRSEPLGRPSGQLVMTSVNDPSAYLAVNIYRADGSYNDDALDQLNHFWRCRRTGTEKAIDPHLFEILSHVYDRFQRPIELVSGFRNQKRTSSYHFIGSASDIRITGVPERELKEFIESLDTGGMGIGIYPQGHFIHVDIRPEPSYRWVDYSPPGSGDLGRPKRRRAPNS
ncbi:MAG: DUF882 domain-containing protein [Myxococcales bacterium]|nr:DUF882 domain-containing protein [Myxococcota bacterium]MDW8280852.1 DUF882 domain-containing protein [Myxococcales bacterium]